MKKGRVEWLGAALIVAVVGSAGCTRTMTADEPSPKEDGGHSNGAADASTGHGENEDPPSGNANASGGSGDQPVRHDAGSAAPQDPDQPPMRCARGSTERIDKIDLLFVVDNSGSMKEEQAALRAQFPKMISTLTAGGASDLHLGVVSSDMGLVGISDIKDCAGLGDDGIMQNEPRLPNCQVSYPRFLSYDAASDAQQIADDFACVATLGTDGCGFEQQLESGLKALWPGNDDRIVFLGDVNGFGTKGHGNDENAGFLRNDPDQGLSLIAVVVVTDEEDCSSKNTVHFTPSLYLDPNNPADAELMKQGLNVRCHGNPQNLYAIERYINGLKALRPGNEDLVMFAAIVGVPPETVGESVLAATDFADPAARDHFYSVILNHTLMQEVIDPKDTPEPADDTLRPSCNTPTGLAYPPRRIVQVAQGFGANGIVQSICQDDFGPAIDAIAGHIGERLAAASCQ